MSVYIVTWNLNKEGSLYSTSNRALHERLNTLETIRDTGLETVRFVSSKMSSSELYDYIVTGILDSNDRILVSELKIGESFGHLEIVVWDWIKLRWS